jgi:uncharacterized protein (DUF305 family)
MQLFRRLFGVLVLIGALSLTLAPASQAKGPAGKFDREYLTVMIGHHSMAVDMAGMATRRRLMPS